MAPNKALVLAKHPIAFPIPGEDLVIETTEIDKSAPPNGLLLKTNHISYDPYMRGAMKPSNPGSYAAGFPLHQPLRNAAISTVLASSTSKFAVGDVLLGPSNFQEFVAIPESKVGDFKKLENPLGVDPRLFLGALGMSGLTAYSSFYEIGKPKKSETIFISAASGAVGQIVGQLAKREGLTVLGSVGSKEKLDFVIKELGFNGGFVYKTESVSDGLKRVLKEAGKESLDIYYDNVGGEQLDVAIENMALHGRIVACGSVSQTSKKEEDKYRLKNMPLVVGRRTTIRGFIVSDADMGPKYTAEHQKNVQKWIHEGSLTAKLSVTHGIDNGAEGLVGMLKGENFGKAILSIAELD